ncbi:MAG TPA: hypothetical protein PLX71_06120 [Phycicoccus sp.]|nr:hypothetical protein [Phycicoccus sp.]
MSRPPGAEAARGPARHTGSTHPPRRRGGLLVATLLVLIAALWATGCAGIGGDGTIHSGLDVGGEDISRVRVSYPGPAAGAGPEQIVRGFVRAGAASDGDYDTARAFLGKNAAKDWSPDGDVVIVSGESDLTIDTAADGSAVLSAPLVATITADGHYVLAAAGSRASVTVTVGQVNGENRITALPTGFGRWVTAADVRRLFQPYAVHYVAVDRRTLVPVLRWFPLDHVTSRLARAQLAPVPADLAGVATTAVVSGTRLSAEAVSVQSGVATVELSQRPPAEQTLRQNLWSSSWRRSPRTRQCSRCRCRSTGRRSNRRVLAPPSVTRPRWVSARPRRCPRRTPWCVRAAGSESSTPWRRTTVKIPRRSGHATTCPRSAPSGWGWPCPPRGARWPRSPPAVRCCPGGGARPAPRCRRLRPI